MGAPMARDDLATGHLIRLFPEINVISLLIYFGAYRPACTGPPKLVTLLDRSHKKVAT